MNCPAFAPNDVSELKIVGSQKAITTTGRNFSVFGSASMRTAHSIWTFLSQELFTVSTVLVGVLTTPLILRWLGNERFGAFETATDWMGYIGILEWVVAESLPPLLTRAYGRRDEDAVRKIVAASLRAYARIAVVMLVLGLIIGAFITRLIPVSPTHAHDLEVAWLIGLCSLPLLPLTAFKLLAQAEQRGYWVNLLLIGQSYIVIAFSVLLAFAGWGITGQAWAVVLGATTFNVVVAVLELRRLPGILSTAIRTPADKDARNAISQLQVPNFTFAVCGRVSYLADNIIVAFIMSPALVVPFFLTQRLGALAASQLQGIGGASWAALAELHAQGKMETFNARLVELTRLVASLAAAVLVPIVAYNHFFIMRWVGAANYGGNLLTTIAACNAVLLAIFSLWSWCIVSTGHIRQLLPAMIAQTIVNVIASVILTIKFGLIGPVSGTLIAFLGISTWYQPMILARLFDTKPFELLFALCQPLIIGIPYGFLVWFFANRYGAANWFVLAWQMSAIALGYISIAWLVVLSKSERAQWVHRFRLTLARADAA
jgi:O-antigen/teichoic acid export membrane protein